MMLNCLSIFAVFNQGFYNASVLETAPYGTCLLKVCTFPSVTLTVIMHEIRIRIVSGICN